MTVGTDPQTGTARLVFKNCLHFSKNMNEIILLLASVVHTVILKATIKSIPIQNRYVLSLSSLTGPIRARLCL